MVQQHRLTGHCSFLDFQVEFELTDVQVRRMSGKAFLNYCLWGVLLSQKRSQSFPVQEKKCTFRARVPV